MSLPVRHAVYFKPDRICANASIADIVGRLKPSDTRRNQKIRRCALPSDSRSTAVMLIQALLRGS